jgi:DNA invertase Pin-like site-specific DNA recombinase
VVFPSLALALNELAHELAQHLRRRAVSRFGFRHELCAQFGFQLHRENGGFRHDQVSSHMVLTKYGRYHYTARLTDKASGKDTQRPELERRRAYVREGDTVVVHSTDRLARNLDDLCRLVQKLTQRGVRIEFVTESLTFTGEDSPMANLMLSVMGAFAEFERALIRERQREGVALAK